MNLNISSSLICYHIILFTRPLTYFFFTGFTGIAFSDLPVSFLSVIFY